MLCLRCLRHQASFWDAHLEVLEAQKRSSELRNVRCENNKTTRSRGNVTFFADRCTLSSRTGIWDPSTLLLHSIRTRFTRRGKPHSRVKLLKASTSWRQLGCTISICTKSSSSARPPINSWHGSTRQEQPKHMAFLTYTNLVHERSVMEFGQWLLYFFFSIQR